MRQKLIQTIQTAFHKEGYGFYQGFLDLADKTNLTLPALWLNPVEVTAMTGHNEGKITYKITLHLLAQNEHDEQQKESKWNEMERIIRHGISKLPKIPDSVVIQTDKVTIQPKELTLTSTGEVALTAIFLADVHFCSEEEQIP